MPCTVGRFYPTSQLNPIFISSNRKVEPQQLLDFVRTINSKYQD